MFPAKPSSTLPTSLPVNKKNLSDPSSTLVIPIIDEQLQVRTEWVETGRVRVSKQVREETQTIDVPITREVVDVQRVPIGRVVEEVPLSRQEGDTLILPVVREEVVTSIRLVLVEEVHITRRQEQTTDSQTVTTRHETIQVDREAAPTDPPAGAADDFS